MTVMGSNPTSSADLPICLEGYMYGIVENFGLKIAMYVIELYFLQYGSFERNPKGQAWDIVFWHGITR